MSETKHTPGPWRWVEGEKGGDGFVVDAQDMSVVDVVSIQRTDAEVVATGRLIAAAPDLLAALETVIDLANTNGSVGGGDLDAARAAIAKARGGA